MSITPTPEPRPSSIPTVRPLTCTVRRLDIPELRKESRVPLRLYRIYSTVTMRQVGLRLATSKLAALEDLVAERLAEGEESFATETEREALIRNYRAHSRVVEAAPIDAAEFLALHVLGMANDDYLEGHPEWQTLVDLARQARPEPRED